MNKLFIYNSLNNKQLDDNDNNYVYSLIQGQLLGDKVIRINDANRLNEIALEQRDTYSKYIFSLNKLFIENSLIYDKRLSFYFISDLSGKRTALYNTYVNICHILLIKEKINNVKIDKIIYDGCEIAFIEALSSIFKSIPKKQSNVRETNLSNGMIILKQAKFFITTMIKIIIIKIFRFKNPQKIRINKLFLTRYPLHFDKNLNEEKYGNMVGKNDYYLISIITDGMHQNLSIKKFIIYINRLRKIKIKYLLLDNLLTINQVIRTFASSILLNRKSKLLIRKLYYYNDINISLFIKYEINMSFVRIPRLLLYKPSILKIFNTNNVDNFFYYLHEFSYGKYFTYLLSNYFPKVVKIGFQHGAPSRRTLLCYLSEKEPGYNTKDFINHLPMPDKLYVESKFFRSVYREAGYKNITIMDYVPRLSYLDKIKRNKIKINTILVAFGMHDFHSMFEQMTDHINKNPDKEYILKFHPKTDYESLKKKIESNDFINVKIGLNHISHYLSYVSEVFVSYSSVGYESYLIGIPVTLLCLYDRINESPLLDIHNQDPLASIKLN